MDKKDLEQIGEIVERTLRREGATKKDLQGLLSDFWEGNLEPAFNELHKEFDERLGIVETKLDKALYKETERITKLEGEMKLVKEKLNIS